MGVFLLNYSQVPNESNDTHKTTNAWKMVLILVIELQVWVSIKGYEYLAFCLKNLEIQLSRDLENSLRVGIRGP